MPFRLRGLVEGAVFSDEIAGFSYRIDRVVGDNGIRSAVPRSVHPRQLLVEIDLRQLGLRRFVLSEERTYMVRTLAITDVVAVVQYCRSLVMPHQAAYMVVAVGNDAGVVRIGDATVVRAYQTAYAVAVMGDDLCHVEAVVNHPAMNTRYAAYVARRVRHDLTLCYS